MHNPEPDNPARSHNVAPVQNGQNGLSNGHLPTSANGYPDLRSPRFGASSGVKASGYELLEILRRGKRVVGSVFVTVLALTILYNVLASPRFEAYSLVLVDTPSQLTPDGADGLAFIDNSGFDVQNGATQTLILQQSLTIAERAEARLKALEAAGEPLSVFDDADKVRTMGAWAAYLQEEYIAVHALGEARRGAIQVTVTSPIATEAAHLANIYAEEYVTLARETSVRGATASRQFLEKQAAKHQSDLLNLERQITEFALDEGGLALESETESTVTQIAQLETELASAQIDIRARQASLRTLRGERERLFPRLEERIGSGVDSEIAETQAEIARLELLAAPFYARNPSLRESPASDPALVHMLSRIDGLKGRVRELSQQYVGELQELSSEAYLSELNEQIVADQVAIGAARAKAAVVQQQLEDYNSRLANIPGQSSRLGQLQRGQASTESLYLAIVEKLQEARIAEESEVGFARMIRPALIPEAPVRPKRGKNVALGSLLGLFLGVVGAIVRHGLDSRIHTPNDLTDRGFLETMAIVPDMTPAIEDGMPADASYIINGREVSPVLAPLLYPTSLSSDAYRDLHLSLKFSHPQGGIRTLLITSAEADVGKSTTAVNLALTAARNKVRTLIVDLDLRRPAVHTLLGADAGADLESVLAEPPPEGSLNVGQFATQIDNLYALVNPTPSEEATEVLGSKELAGLLSRLEQAFDLIIFDSAPVLLATDSKLVSMYSDATLLVARAGSTDAEALDQAVKELESVNADVVGVVLNRFNPLRMYGYKNTYGYRYNEYESYSVDRVGGTHPAVADATA